MILEFNPCFRKIVESKSGTQLSLRRTPKLGERGRTRDESAEVQPGCEEFGYDMAFAMYNEQQVKWINRWEGKLRLQPIEKMSRLIQSAEQERQVGFCCHNFILKRIKNCKNSREKEVYVFLQWGRSGIKHNS